MPLFRVLDISVSGAGAPSRCPGPDPASLLRLADGAVAGPVVDLEVSDDCTARELLLQMGLSKPVVARVFQGAQLVALRPEGPSALAPHSRLQAGDLLRLHTSSCGGDEPEDPVPVRVLYEDPVCLTVEKPQGILVHSDGTGAATLSARVQAHVRAAGETVRVQAVQRLDVPTSGVVLFSKTSELQCLFDELVSSGGLTKRYLAVCRGAFDAPARDLDAPLGRDRHDARKMRTCAPGAGQEALTHVERLCVSRDRRYSLLAVTLGTGRKHQIRVHLSSAGFPLVNDELYGRVESSAGLALHAWREEFRHPLTGMDVVADAGWPERFDAWFDRRAIEQGRVE